LATFLDFADPVKRAKQLIFRGYKRIILP